MGRSSSNLSKSEFSDLIELIHQFGANHGVVFGDQSVAEDA
ncbi:recombination protein NinB [Bradyrhizobium sp. 2]|nr:recombination protein NinB [Bradyrhizobium sp. 2]